MCWSMAARLRATPFQLLNPTILRGALGTPTEKGASSVTATGFPCPVACSQVRAAYVP